MHYDTGRRRGSFLAIAALLAGCGSQSTAASDSVHAATPAGGTAQAMPAAASQTVLPIEQGLYISGYKTPEGIYLTIDDSPGTRARTSAASWRGFSLRDFASPINALD